MMELELIYDTLKYNKWWRYFNLTGLNVKLINPITRDYNPEFKGDPNYVTIVSYAPCIHSSIVGIINQEDIHLYSDWVLFKNDRTPVNRNYSIHLSLVDFEHFKTLNI